HFDIRRAAGVDRLDVALAVEALEPELLGRAMANDLVDHLDIEDALLAVKNLEDADLRPGDRVVRASVDDRAVVAAEHDVGRTNVHGGTSARGESVVSVV